MLANENKKRLLALAITGTMVTGMLPISALAEDGAAGESLPDNTATVGQTENQIDGAQQPAEGTPAAEAPTKEAPVVEASAEEVSSTEEPKAEGAVTEEPKAEDPAPEKPKAEEPKADTPATEEPATEEPKEEAVVPEEKVPEAIQPAELLAAPELAQPRMLFVAPQSDTQVVEGDGTLTDSAYFSVTQVEGNAAIYFSYNGRPLEPVTEEKLEITHFRNWLKGNVIFCVAPQEGYAVTSVSSTGKNVITPLEKIPQGLAGGVARDIVQQAQSLGCTAALWYSRDWNNNTDVKETLQVTSQPYGVVVTQAASVIGKVAPGTEVTFTATPAPEQQNDIAYTYSESATYTIKNGNKTLATGTATKNTDGTYSYKYTVTEQDAGKSLTAAIEVPYTYTSKWGGGSFHAGTTTESTVMVQSQVEYRFDGIDSAIAPKLPENQKKWNEGDKFNIPQAAHSYKDITTDGGVYRFTGWTVATVSGKEVPFDKDQKTFNMPAEAVVITGHWSFAATTKYTLYRKGYVSGTLSGSPKGSYAFDSTVGPNGETAIGNFPSTGATMTEADYAAVKTALANKDYAALAAKYNNVANHVPDSVTIDETAHTVTVNYQRIQFYVLRKTLAATGNASNYTTATFDMTGKLSNALAAKLMQSGKSHDGNYVLDGERANVNVGANTKFDVSANLTAMPENNALTDALDKAKISYHAESFNGSGKAPIRWYLVPVTTNDGVHVDGVLTEGRVIYQWKDGKAPAGVTLPTDDKWYGEGDTATVDTTKFEKIVDDKGTWEFDNKWATDKSVDIKDGKFTMPDGTVTLTGSWTFTAKEKPPVTPEVENAGYTVRYHNLTTNTDIATVNDDKLTAKVGTAITDDLVRAVLGNAWQNEKLPAGYEFVSVTYPTLAKGATNEVVVNYRQTTNNGGGNNGGGNNGGGNTGGGNNGGGNTVNVTEPNVPLGGQPTDSGTNSGTVTVPTTEPTVTIEDTEVPLTGAPEITIEDGKTPLAATPDKTETNPNDVPRTGDTSPIALLLALLGSALGGIVLLRKRDVQR